MANLLNRNQVLRAAVFASIETLESRTMLSVAAPVGVPMAEVFSSGSVSADGSATLPSSALTPTQIRNAYGVNAISLKNVTTADGSGQTIAIIDAYNDPNALADLKAFDAKFGLADPPSFKQLNQNGGTALPGVDTSPKPDTWELEESLDIEWAHAIAPKANIILFEANSSSLSDLFAAVNTAKNTAGVSVVSMSFSTEGDFSGETSYDSVFTSVAGHGVTFLGATGDDGTAAGFPAISPNVIGVGGTTLSTNSSGSYLGESAWNGSSGSISTIEAQPSYQSGVVTQTTTKRAGPDVSMDADPNSGVAVYDSFDGSSTGGNWFQIGGTSLSTPMWGGLIAIVNQGRVANGLAAYDGRTGTLPRLYALPSTDFHDITTGSNASFHAGTGFDLVTGRGSPIANKLVADLANVAAGTGPVQPPPPPPVNKAPVITSLTSTAATKNKVFTLTATVTDSAATVTSVSFYYENNGKSGLQIGSNGDPLLAKVTSGAGGWKINLTAATAGNYTLYAVATDSNGLTSTPAVITVTVQNATTATKIARLDAITKAKAPAPYAPPAFASSFTAATLFGLSTNKHVTTNPLFGTASIQF